MDQPDPGDSSARIAPGRVSFMIGDSSEYDSVSTVESNSLIAQGESIDDGQQLATNCCNDNPWHKYHFRVTPNESSTPNGAPHSDDEISSASTPPEVTPASYNTAQCNDTIISVSSSGSATLRKWRILVACAVVQLFSALMVSLQAPFYPAEAEKKGATATQYGFVFGIFELTVFIVAPIYGSMIHKWNPRTVFTLGVVSAAVSSVIFGLLDKIVAGNYFILACALVRALEAIGESAVVTASFVIVASVFPDSVASTFALLETFYSAGLLSGPIVGSLLYQIGGFSLPFFAVGGGLTAVAIFTFLLLPTSKEIVVSTSQAEPIVISSYKSFRLLSSVPVLVSSLCIVIGAMSISFIQTTLEPHLRQFQLSQLAVGAILIINGGVYTLTAPLWGILCDKVYQLKLVTFFGSAILVFGYSLVGPVPVLQFEPTVWIISVGLMLQGIGLGAVFVASFVSILRTTISNGWPDSPSTYGLVSSLWTSMFSLGSFLGPCLSGILYDSVGFSRGTLLVIVFSLVMMSILVLFVCISDAEMNSFHITENDPLLNNTSSIYSDHLNDQSSRLSYGAV